MIFKLVEFLKNFYLCGDGMYQENGLMAARAALCACHEANMIARLLLGEKKVYKRKERIKMNSDKLILGGYEFTSRFILGSGKFSLELVSACIEKS